MTPFFISGVFQADASQYAAIEADSTINQGAKVASGANKRIIGVLAKSVVGASSTAPITESVQTVGITFVNLASGASVSNGDPVKSADSSGNVTKAATSSDHVFGYARQSLTGPGLLSIVLDINSDYF